MMKKSKVLFSLLFALIMVFQLAAPMASAANDDALVTFSYELLTELTEENAQYINDRTADPDDAVEAGDEYVVGGELEEALLGGICVLKSGESSLSRGTASVDAAALKASGLTVTVPEGYYIDELLLVDAEGSKAADLMDHATARKDSAALDVFSKDLLNEEGTEFVFGALEEGSYTVRVLVKVIDEDGDNEIDIDFEDEAGKDIGLKLDGNKLPAAMEGYDSWLITYEENETSVVVKPGEEIAPYDDCDITPYLSEKAPVVPPVEKPVISISVNEGLTAEADVPLPTEFCTMNIPEGLTVEADVSYILMSGETEIGDKASEAGTYEVVLVVNSIKVTKDGAELGSDDYDLVLNNGSVVYSAPELKVQIKANAPVADGDSFKANGHGEAVGLRNGDKLDTNSEFTYEVVYEGEGAERKARVVMTGEAKFLNGSGQPLSSSPYTVEFLKSDPVDAPVNDTPQTTAITVNAMTPVYKDGSFVLPAEPVFEAVEGLAEGEYVKVTAEVKSDSEGGYFTQITSGGVYGADDKPVEGKYDISYNSSAKIYLVTVTAKDPSYNADKKDFEVNTSDLYTVSGLRDEDKLDTASVKHELKKEADSAYVSITAASIVKKDGSALERADKYAIKYVPSQKVAAPAAPAEKITITITAKKPVLGADGKTFNTDGFTYSPELKDGDAFKANSVKLELKDSKDGKSVYVVPSLGVIENGGKEVKDKYSFNYEKSEDVLKPAEPEKPAERGEITLKPEDVKVPYDGKEHTAVKCSTSVKLAEGDKLTVTIKGGRTDVGESETEITKYQIMNGTEDVTSKYTVKTEKGKIIIEKRDATFKAIGQGSNGITVQVKDENKTVNASSLKLNDGSYEGGYEAEGLVDGHKVDKITVNGSGKAGSTFTSSVDKNSVKIVDAKGNDVTANYNIKTVDGKITVKTGEKPVEKGIPLTITAKDANWTYDGKAHESHEYSHTELKDGDSIKTVNFKKSSSITDAGSVKNEIESVVIVDKNGKNVPSGKYKVNAKSGTLTVEKFNITVTAESASKTYDGKPLDNKNVTISKLANSKHTIEVVYNVYTAKDKLIKNAPIEAGTYTKKITSVVIKDENGKDVSANYNIKKVDGTLTIKSGDKNNSTGPKTGDESNLGLWITLLAVSAAVVIAVVVVIIIKNKKKAEEAEITDEAQDEENSGFEIDMTEFNNESSDSEDHSDKE